MGHHLVLLGDSILDNSFYVPGEPAIIDQVRRLLPERDKVTLLAVDGSTTKDVKKQLTRISDDATQLVLSVGGNDALQALEQLNGAVSDMGQALQILSHIRSGFQAAYRSITEALRDMRRPTIACTIYEDIPGLPDMLKTALAIFNDTIYREAMIAGFPVIDLRDICSEDQDFSTISPIEPSSRGGEKIATAIVRATLAGEKSSAIRAQ